MTPETSAPGLDDLTDSILPALIARLRASRLGELEVRTPDWRVRLRRDLTHARRTAHAATGDTADTDDDDRDGSVARSPAVGYFSPVGELVVGQLVQSGDALGSVDVLGLAQDVVAPTGGIVRAVLVEHGQAVEYGQHLVEIDALALESSAADAAAAGARPDIADAGA
jgi:acetyl-CoA carboxylase biotin carboxyl carrier protein